MKTFPQLRRLVVLAAALLCLPLAQARPIQIIHTNDLHSHLDHAEDPGTGGYAAVKEVIDSLRADAEARGIPTLVLDAGDFTEGSRFYFADRSREVWRIMDSMGYDAVTMGNHDWLMGARELDSLLGDVRPRFPLLAANFSMPEYELRHMQDKIRPSVELERDGLGIAILGVTTPSFVYDWIAREGRISSHVAAAHREIPNLRSRNDAVIVLSHVGLDGDLAMAEQVPGVDLVIGGHSHDQLAVPVYVRNKRSARRVPIVQTGKHGTYVGDLLVDIEPGSELKVLRYRLVPVLKDRGEDPEIARRIVDIEGRLDADYGRDWLDEVIGASEVPLERQSSQRPTAWSTLLTDGMRTASGADTSFDIPEFSGIRQDAGAVTRRMLMDLYPRQFSFEQKFGWTVWTAEIRGWILKLALEQALLRDVVFTASALTYRDRNVNGKRRIDDIRINGRPIEAMKNYRVAMPEGIGRGVVEINEWFSVIIKRANDSGIPVWSAVESELRSRSRLQ